MRYIIITDNPRVRFVRATVGDTFKLVAQIVRDETAAVWVKDTKVGRIHHCSNLSGLLEDHPSV
jgi:hypothetical protein